MKEQVRISRRVAVDTNHNINDDFNAAFRFNDDFLMMDWATPKEVSA